MPIRVQCPQCGKEYNVGDDKAGRRFQCKGCQASVTVPAPAAAGEPDDPFAGMDDFSEDFASSSPKAIGAKPSTPANGDAKGKGNKQSRSESGGVPAGAWIGGGVAVAAAIALGVFLMTRGGDDDEGAPAGGNNNVADTNNDDASAGGGATPGPAGHAPAGNTPTGNTPSSGSGESSTTVQSNPPAGPSPADLDATLRQLKDIVLGMHNYHDTHGGFPVSQNMAAAIGPDGKPFLSWRVHLLPFVDQKVLYDQFRLNEPWDSAHNLPLADQLPAIYRTPGEESEGTKTRFVVLTGPTATFDNGMGKGLRNITDGTSSTILVTHVPADHAVPWTKPDDLPFDPADPLACIGGAIPPSGLPVGMADGACFFLSPDADAAMFASFVQPADAQIVDQSLLLHNPADYVVFQPPRVPPSGLLPLAYLTDDCIGLMRIAPKRLLAAEWLASALPPGFTQESPIPLDTLEESVFWISPRPDAPIPADPDSQFALRFSQPIAIEDLPLDRLPPDSRPYLHNESTVVIARGDRFERMFSGSGAASPLNASLLTAQMDADVYMAFQLQSDNFSVDWSEAQLMLAAAGELGQGLMQARQVQLAFRASESPLLKVWLTFPDDSAAGTYKTALEQQVQALLEQQKSNPVGGTLATLLSDAWSVSQEASTVSLEIAHSDALTAELASIVSQAVAPVVMDNPGLNPAQRMQNNLRQILLASHMYHDAYLSFPVAQANAQAFDENGKPFLSWRVHLLPYLEEAELYQEFHFDEPWDSEHNMQLLERMPAVYRFEDGHSAELDPGMTRIVRADGEGTLCQNGRGGRLSDVIDGTTNTAFCFAVGPEHAVPWTKPEDIVIDFSQPILPQLGLPEGENFLVGMCDGVAAEVLPTIDDENLRRLLLHNDREVLEIPFAP